MQLAEVAPAFEQVPVQLPQCWMLLDVSVSQPSAPSTQWRYCPSHEAMVQLEFTRRILAGAKEMGLHTAIQTSGYLGDKVDDRFLSVLDLVMLDIKSSDPETYRKVTARELAPTLRFAERLAKIGKPVWVRFTLVPGHTDDPANVEGIARFVAPMKNVEWVEVQPFHQMGAFKWKAMNLEYKHADTAPPSPELVARVLEQFRAAGCKAR